jgi:hypothetical protein
MPVALSSGARTQRRSPVDTGPADLTASEIATAANT